MSAFKSFRDVIAQWDSDAEFASDIGVITKHAQVMKVRNFIAMSHWPSIVSAAKRRKYQGITLEVLMALALRANRAPRRTARSREMRAAP